MNVICFGDSNTYGYDPRSWLGGRYDKESTVLVYCRSGNRSKTASAALAELGYTEIYEFGGIKTRPYETEP